MDTAEWSSTLKLYRIDKGIEEGHYSQKQWSVYLSSDLHLDHTKIIGYCARPFISSNISEMNNVLVTNWNNTVGNNKVYFLGDLSFGKEARPASYWLDRLQGKVHFIRGCHDIDIVDSQDSAVFQQGRYKFLMIHDPDQLPFNWNHWIIHGHKHNNDMKNYPFINGDRKTINISPELVNYKPLSLDYLISLEPHSIKRMDTIDSIPVTR